MSEASVKRVFTGLLDTVGMIIAKIYGGLGNQLFQYAIGKAVSAYFRVPLKLDITAYDTYDYHNGFRLNQFQIHAEVARKDEIVSLRGGGGLFSKLSRKAGLMKTTYYAERERTIYDAEVFSTGHRYLEGYWQNQQYFLSVKGALIREIVPTQPLKAQALVYQDQLKEVEAVGLHVRRGDYLKNPHMGVLGLSYYQHAVDYVSSFVKSPVFFVFSNDLSWCKTNLTFLKNPIFIEGTDSEIEDMMLMAQCQHNIIANSSFSWWAAWLNQNNAKVIVAPKNWVVKNPRGHRWTPDEWVEF